MAVNWDALFGQDYFISITNEERHYLALDPIRDDWDITRYYPHERDLNRRPIGFSGP